MTILGVDTAGPEGGVALLGPAGLLGARELGEPGRHAERLVPSILEVLAEAHQDWEGLAGLAVNEGPGSFTGVRVGVALVLGMSRARGIPALGVGCLDILARACYDATDLSTGTYILGATDVRRGEVVVARFRCHPEGPRREEEDYLLEVAHPGTPPARGAVLAGDGAALLWPDRPGLERWTGSGAERAAAACRLARGLLTAGTGRPPEPRYARPPGTGSRRTR